MGSRRGRSASTPRPMVNELVVALISGGLGALGTLGVAALRARGTDEANDIEAARVASAAQARAIETLQQRLDTMESRLADAEDAEARCRERLEDEREQRKKLESTVADLEGAMQEVHRRYDALVAKIEEDSDVGWDPHQL